jgi:hypothetical protein
MGKVRLFGAQKKHLVFGTRIREWYPQDQGAGFQLTNSFFMKSSSTEWNIVTLTNYDTYE